MGEAVVQCSLVTAAQRQLRARIGALSRLAHEDTTQMTAPARTAFLAKFEREVDPEHRLSPDERSRRAAAARKLHFTRLALRSVNARANRNKAEAIVGEG